MGDDTFHTCTLRRRSRNQSCRHTPCAVRSCLALPTAHGVCLLLPERHALRTVTVRTFATALCSELNCPIPPRLESRFSRMNPLFAI